MYKSKYEKLLEFVTIIKAVYVFSKYLLGLIIYVYNFSLVLTRFCSNYKYFNYILHIFYVCEIPCFY